MDLSSLLANQPPARYIQSARQQVRDALVKSGKRLVVIDDDPTGMQTVQDVSVFMDWSVATLRKALASPSPVFFVSVNSRSLDSGDARNLAFEVGQNLHQAAEIEGVEILLASRSDSTLRGHFPYEVDSLVSGYRMKPDGIIFAPAFFEAGRYTVDDTHWADIAGDVIPVHETEFAHDPMFSFKNSDLKAWVEEKTLGAIRAENVMSISLKLLRDGGQEKVAQQLLLASNGVPIIINAAEYADLDVLSLAIQEAEEKGKRFVYRCSASFLKSRGGFEDRPLLTQDQMVSKHGPGLIVVGSYVEKTSQQLKRLLDAGLAEGVEVQVDEILDRSESQKQIEVVSQEVNARLHDGITTAIYTSRKVRLSQNKSFAETGKSIVGVLCEVVRGIKFGPAYVVAKGGITSVELAKNALGVKEAFALGQILPGVPAWWLGEETIWPGITYVVFPGNVGDDGALLKAIKTPSGK